jgi:hypothetical protein
MSNQIEISCPVSSEKVNESAVRIVAFFVILISLSAIFTNNYFITALLVVDFSLRAFTSGKFSPLKFVARKIVGALNIQGKQVDAAPKKFAALLGVLFSFSVLVLQILKLFVAAKVVGSILIFCASLEGALGICLGCIVYSYLIIPFSGILRGENAK